MTNQSILAAVDNWARELHLKFSAEILSEPPPILDFQHLTIPYQRLGNSAGLTAWLNDHYGNPA
jgi:hypothetical protein